MNKKLYKSRTDKAVSGVCAGIADYFNIDVVIVRLLTVIFCFVSFGTVLIAYIVAAIIMPEEPTVRMDDGTRRPVYETTYEYASENGAGFSGGAGDGGSAAGGAAGSDGSAEFYTESGNGQQNGAYSEGYQSAQPGSYEKKETSTTGKSSGTWIIGLVLIAMGAYLIFDWFFPWISWRIFGALILIVLGLIVLVKR